MKVLDTIWFSPMGGAIIGVVKVETEYDGIKFYIGTASGEDKEDDSRHIAERGSTFPISAGEILIP